MADTEDMSSSIETPKLRMDPKVIEAYQRNGFAIVRNLFSEKECNQFSDYFTAMIERGGDGYAETNVDTKHPDPLKRYPRLLQPHRSDEVAFEYMTDRRIRDSLISLSMGAEPFAVQTMVYFKPPGGRGQNLHQDNMYLLVHPGTCIAAWLALDDCDEENGCMVFVPNTGDLPIICQVETPGLDEEQWGNIETPLPPHSAKPVHALMKKGDVVFFNGNVVHGSFKNRSETRFRRSLIGHYIAAEAKQVAKYYFPVFRLDGTRLDEGFEQSAPGGPCGVYENDDIKLSGTFKAWEAAH
jgi:phytanoyl-CoA hydroxylase